MLTRRSVLAAAFLQRAPHVVFVTGDDEYRSEYSMPALAALLEKHHGVKTSVAHARPTPQTPDNIEGLDALKTADLAVFYLRWRALPDAQMKLILDYVESGKPLAGFRTSTHSFKYPKGHAHEKWNDGFGRDIFGQRWIRHHGHLSSTDVTTEPRAKDHPILRGVPSTFHVRSWLYVLEPFDPGATILLTGHTVNPQNGRDYGPQAVAWTKSYRRANVFFTTLGHPEDFQEQAMRQLSVNGLLWALGRDIPEQGARCDWARPYKPPESGIPPAKR